jgi:hypothetical protein
MIISFIIQYFGVLITFLSNLIGFIESWIWQVENFFDDNHKEYGQDSK